MGIVEQVRWFSVRDTPILEKVRLRLESTVKLGLIIAFCHSEAGYTECLSLIKGPVAVDVQSCGSIKPEAFDTKKEKYRFIADLDHDGRKLLLDQYRGLAVKGKVARSQAIQEGLSKDKGVLQGQEVLLFIPPEQKLQCTTIGGKRLVAVVQERCCDGASEAPCLLGTGLTLSDIRIGDKSRNLSSVMSEQDPPPNARGKDYQEAEKLYANKKFKLAVAAFKKADLGGDMDLRGLVRWGFAARNTEDCPGAVLPLKRVYEQVQAGKVWAEDELDSRRGVFLLARCHAKMGEASNAVFYLNGFLLEPKKFRTELQQSLSHKDFGWIHTTKEYREYATEARKRLAQP